MILFSHLGIGNTLAAPFRHGLPRRWILLGTVFPDLIDKPLYYGFVLFTKKHGADLGLICGTRTFGHTGLLLILVSGLAFAKKSRVLAALAIGMATHLLLDGVTDYYWVLSIGMIRVNALTWPFLNQNFPVMPHRTVLEHISSWRNPFFIGSEIVGALLLGWQLWKDEHKLEIISFFQKKRIDLRLLKHRRALKYNKTR